MKGESVIKKLIKIITALNGLLSMAACGGSGDTDGGSNAGNSEKTASGKVVTAEIPASWQLLTGDIVCGDDSFDFIFCSDNRYYNYFSIIRDWQSVEHYKDMIATGNYGRSLGTVVLGEGTWCIAEKVAAGPIGKYTCVIQGQGCDLSSDEVLSVLASLKWVD